MQLKAIQGNFLDHVVKGKSHDWSSVIKTTGKISTQTRLEIYQNNIFSNLISSLKSTYPTIWGLAGEDFAKGIAREYCRDNLPKTTLIDEWGEKFPHFMKRHKLCEDIPYIADVGHIEWLMHLSYWAEDTPSTPSEDLQKFAPEEIADLVFTFHPSFGKLKSIYPLEPIFDLAESETNQVIDYTSGRAYCLVIRQKKPVRFWVSADTYQFFDQLSSGKTLGQAYERVQDPTFDIQNVIAFLIANKFVTLVQKGGHQ